MKLTCPKCSAELPREEAYPASGVCRCATCQQFFKLSAALPKDLIIARYKKPDQSSVEFEWSPHLLRIAIPVEKNRTAGFAGLLLAFFWNVCGWALFAAAFGQSDFSAKLTYLLPVNLVGLALAGLAFYRFEARFALLIDHRECGAIWSFFKWKRVRTIPVDEISAVAEDVVYDPNYGPSYSIGIHHGKHTLSFGSDLSADERAWLVGEICHFLNVPDERIEPVQRI